MRSQEILRLHNFGSPAADKQIDSILGCSKRISAAADVRHGITFARGTQWDGIG
jgi:hypothetical protein